MEQIHAILIADTSTFPCDGNPDLQPEQLRDDTKTVATSGIMEDNVQGDKPSMIPGQSLPHSQENGTYSLPHSQENETYIGTVVKQEMPDPGPDEMEILPEERKSFITPEELLNADRDHIINVLGGLANNDKHDIRGKVTSDKKNEHTEKRKRKNRPRETTEKMENVDGTLDFSKSEDTDDIDDKDTIDLLDTETGVSTQEKEKRKYKARQKGKVWQCSVCKLICPSQANLIIHNRTHTGIKFYSYFRWGP